MAQYGSVVPRIWKGRGEVQAPQFGEMQAGHGMLLSRLEPRPLKFQASEKIEGLEMLAAKKGKHEKEAWPSSLLQSTTAS